MKVLICTNAYPPPMVGIARTVQLAAHEFHSLGHQTLVVAPESDTGGVEDGVCRVSFPHGFPTSDGLMSSSQSLLETLNAFGADIVHAHHASLVGGVALRTAAMSGVPLVFTHHASCECSARQLPLDSPIVQRLVAELVMRYCNRCDAVIVPGRDAATALRRQGVRSPITAIPTEAEGRCYVQGETEHARAELGIPLDALVVGVSAGSRRDHWPPGLPEAMTLFLARARRAYLLLIARRGAEASLGDRWNLGQMQSRVRSVDCRRHVERQAAYLAMDVLVDCNEFSSHRQELVEALSAGVPVIAHDDRASRELIEDGKTGRLLPKWDVKNIGAALEWFAGLAAGERIALHAAIHAAAERLMLRDSALQMLGLYTHLIEERKSRTPAARELPLTASAWVDEEMQILSNMADAFGDALLRS